VSALASRELVDKLRVLTGIPGATGYEYSSGTNCCPEILNWNYIQPRYELDGPGIELGGRDFPHPSRLALGPTQRPVQWVPGHSWGVKRPGRGVDHPPLSSADVKERVVLYFRSLCVFMPDNRVKPWPCLSSFSLMVSGTWRNTTKDTNVLGVFESEDWRKVCGL